MNIAKLSEFDAPTFNYIADMMKQVREQLFKSADAETNETRKAALTEIADTLIGALSRDDKEHARACLSHMLNTADRHKAVIERSMWSYVCGQVNRILNVFDAPPKWVAVTVYLPNREIADAFIGYMSDGGGEYGFFETDEGQDTSFEYFGDAIYVTKQAED